MKATNPLSYVDAKECTGCESCVAGVPKVFRMTVDGVAQVFDPQGDSEKPSRKRWKAVPSPASTGRSEARFMDLKSGWMEKRQSERVDATVKVTYAVIPRRPW